MPTLAERHVTLMLKRAPDSRAMRVGSVVAFGVIDTSGETLDDGNGAAVRRLSTVITLPSNAFPTLAEGGTVSVFAGRTTSGTPTSYIVRDKLPAEDGLIMKYLVVPS